MEGVPTETWVDLMDIELQQLSPLSNWSIWRVPISLRMVNEDAYIPRIISIGPLHHGRQNVQSLEIHKLYYMQALLQRTPNIRETLNACAKTIEDFDKKIRACYAEPIEYKENELARMFLIDGCFILELFLRHADLVLKPKDDPIFNTSWMISALQRDLVLLENQIPFFVLEWLFDIAVMNSSIGHSLPTLQELAFVFFKSSNFRWNEERFRASRRQFPHLLGLIHSCSLPGQGDPTDYGRWTLPEGATLLHAAGIMFKRRTEENLFELKFENGVLEIPCFYASDHSESFFRNLIAYEQFFHGTAQYVTSYFYFMSRLITTVRDAEFLGRRAIIENDLGTWEEVTFLYNNMSKQVVLNNFCYAGLCEHLNAFYWKRWNIWQALLRRVYFTNPWAAILVNGATLLVSLIFLLTLYTILSYYRR